jgi:muramoyltetrapeptide carboxypeptidase
MAFFVYFCMHKRPDYLKKGDRVAIVAPAGKVKDGGLIKAVEILKSWSLEVAVSPHALDGYDYFSGTDEHRLSDLQSAVDINEYSAIFCARGGYGLTRIIDKIDFTHFIQYPKWIIGFSDITALHLALSRLGFQSLHAVMPTGFESAEQFSIDEMREVLFGKSLTIRTKENLYNREGSSTARSIGGNLSLISSSIGTQDEINTKGKILFIEEIDEYLYKIDRMMGQLERSGKLSELAGLVVGHMSVIKDTSIPFGANIQEVMLQHVHPYEFPVLFDVPIGHEPLNLPIVQEGTYHLEVTNNKEGILSLEN